MYKSDNNNVLVSGIIPSSDKPNAKAIEVNRYLKNDCRKRNICFISNSNINRKYDWNKNGLHLNWKETNKLVKNFLIALSNFDNWQKAPVSKTNFYKNKLGNLSPSNSSEKTILEQRSLKTCETWKEKKHKNIFLGHLNINSIKNKFESVRDLIKDTFDIFVAGESKLDSMISFQFPFILKVGTSSNEQ